MGGCAGRDIRHRALTMGADSGCYSDYSGPGPWFTCTPDGEMKPRVAQTGVASAGSTPPTTLAKLLAEAAAAKGDRQAFMVERPLPPLGEDGKAPPALPLEEWTQWTYKEFHDEVRCAAAAMISLGFKPFDSVSVWGFNSPEWVMAALASNFAGGKVAGLYPTDTQDAAAYKVVHSGASVVVVEDRAKITKLVAGLKERKDATRIKAIVAWGFEPDENEKVDIVGCGSVPLMSWKTLVAKGRNEDESVVDGSLASIQPGQCAAIIYTSGTTGEPKAVMISHDNLVYESSVVIEMIRNSVGFGGADAAERILSYLPLSHVAGMMVDIVTPILFTAKTLSVETVFFARSYDLKAGSVKDRLCAARPTMFLGVPLVWEKIAGKMRALGADASDTKKAVASWAKGMGLDHANSCQLGGSGEKPWGFALADTLVLGNIKAALGLDQCKFAMTGAAPIRVDTLEYFGSLGIQINEVYGMSECSGASTWSLDECHQWGSCGFEIPGCEVKAYRVDEKDLNIKTECKRAPDLDTIDEEYQGELCFRGRNIMMGYMACPDMGSAHQSETEKKTAETIDKDGWLHSGDKGMVTESGMVKITGRYKELIIGDGGENIAPVPIENHVKKMCDGILEIVMIGDKRKYNVAVITLQATEGTETLELGAKRVNPEVTTISGAMDDKVWIETLTEAINSANTNPKICANPTFKIQKFTILPAVFSEENGELTPTKKVKRKVIETKYAEIIEKMYKDNGVYIRYGETAASG